MKVAIWKANEEHTGLAVAYPAEDDLIDRLYNMTVKEWPNYIIDTVNMNKYRIVLDQQSRIRLEIVY